MYGRNGCLWFHKTRYNSFKGIWPQYSRVSFVKQRPNITCYSIEHFCDSRITYKSQVVLKTNNPYFSPTGELWGVQYENVRENWLRYYADYVRQVLYTPWPTSNISRHWEVDGTTMPLMLHLSDLPWPTMRLTVYQGISTACQTSADCIFYFVTVHLNLMETVDGCTEQETCFTWRDVVI